MLAGELPMPPAQSFPLLIYHSCETTKFTRPGDFLVFVVFCGIVIVVSGDLESVPCMPPALPIRRPNHSCTQMNSRPSLEEEAKREADVDLCLATNHRLLTRLSSGA